ncbi:MAG TPA: SDR family oxidoreductase [Levilinea sp.]|nr:SDR family oxidoreductase [Levilinea sp.]
MTVAANMQGKVVLITGGTSGIGRVAAKELVRLGAKVIITARSEQKAQETVRAIRQAVSGAEIEYLLADLSVMQQVRSLAGEFRRRYDRLDVLLNNAGSFYLKPQTSVDGIELTWALNHLHYFLLTLLLVDRLVGSAPARAINVSSNVHRGERIDFEALRMNRMKGFLRGYRQTKLANIYFTYELARRLEGCGVTANALHPGLVATDLGPRDPIGGLFMRLLRPFSITPEDGAQTLIYLAASPEVEGVTGKYFYQCKQTRSSPVSYDVQVARQLWDWSLQTAGFEQDPTTKLMREPFRDKPVGS